MARQERPVDPAAGPLASFAYDLRKLRLEAGQPTYRVLAKAAGYSASTLSEAASGQRRPSLDVVLAYVGACGGDVTAWRARWLALDEELRPARGIPVDERANEIDDKRADEVDDKRASETDDDTDDRRAGERDDDLPGDDAPDGPDPRGGGTTASDDVPAGPPGESAESDHRWWSRPKIGLAAAAGLTLFGIAVAQIVQLPDKQLSASAANPDCPAVSDTAAFTATTYGSGVYVRRGPALDEPIVHMIPAGCVVGLSGYCLGEKVGDTTSGTPDIRWFRLDDGTGVIASAVVHGNPPADLGPSRCDNDQPWPASVVLDVSAGPPGSGRLEFSADGTHLDIVGFAVYHAPDPDLPEIRKWRQVGLIGKATPTFGVSWQFTQIRNPPKPTDRVLVAAVACLGGNGATEILDVREARIDGSSQPALARLGPMARAAAARSACSYPVAD